MCWKYQDVDCTFFVREVAALALFVLVAQGPSIRKLGSSTNKELDKIRKLEMAS